MKVYALIPYPLYKGPSQRFRLAIFMNYFLQEDIHIEASAFYSERAYSELYHRGKILRKVYFVLGGFLRRFFDLFKLYKFDVIFVQRELTPIGPPIFLWLITKVFRKKVIYDFDDAIWMPNYSANNAAFHRLKAYWKTKYFIKWSYKVFAGNAFLLEYSLKYNSESILIPTVVDTENVHNRDLFTQKSNIHPIIGWTGSVSTMHFLEVIYPILDRLSESYEFTLRIISNERPNIQRDYIQFIKWSEENEISALNEIDLGVMPLKDDFEFAKGKCGFKLIQYMSLGKTVIANAIGVNTEIVENKVTGYLCYSVEDWHNYLEDFLSGQMPYTGEKALKKIREKYSVQTVLPDLISAFRS